ncbi:MAG TPA: alpha/beta fold hydrolase [Lichenihabitans sp.]|jgi:flavin reductase (DIM6/NTAB) family NADH-FMN oxidoreductase RutF/pimeloyl-ACP methyl ester carboxylesterase|nr:alpha/beta fold hydrolase [Lichenihabitans sp.]
MSERRTITYRDRTGAEARVAFRRSGRGTPVVLIHGVGLQGVVWTPQIEALTARHDVIALDMPGHGGSSLPPENARLADYADAVAALLDALAIGKAHVIGHSMGALVATQFALDRPARVSSLVAMNAVFCRSAEQRAAIEARLSALDGRRPDWSDTIGRWFGAPVPAALEDAAQVARRLLDAADPLGYQRTYRLFATSDAAHRDRLSGLAVPALFMTGEGDLNSSPAMTRAMAALAPEARVDIVSGERHMMALTAPVEVNARLMAFLAKVETREPTPLRPPAPSLDPKSFRKALGSFLTGVTVVATLQEDGEPRGFTANSFTSVSLDPPLVLICIAKTASSFPVFSGAGHFSVNILAEHQAPVSSLFATKAADKFARASWRRGPAGSPILEGVAAWFDCRRHDVVEAGDHIILIGEVLGFDQTPANPLGYCRGAHITFGLQLDALAASGGRTRVGAILEHDSSIVLVDDGKGGFDLPSGAVLGAATESASLHATLRRLDLEADLSFLFAVYEDPARGAGAMSIIYRGTLRDAPAGANGAALVRFDDIAWDRIRDEALKSMLHRYIQERREDLFGVYVGDAERGTVQPLARSA